MLGQYKQPFIAYSILVLTCFCNAIFGYAFTGKKISITFLNNIVGDWNNKITDWIRKVGQSLTRIPTVSFHKQVSALHVHFPQLNPRNA